MRATAGLVFFGIIAIIVIALLLLGFHTVQPGDMGVRVTLGKVDETPLSPGYYFVVPGASRIENIGVQTQSANFNAACFSADLQTLNANITVIYQNLPEKVVTLYTKYQGDVLHSLLVPNTQESLKEVTALRTAENIVQQREQVKTQALDLLRKRMEPYGIVNIADFVIVNIDLSPELEKAIELKMVQQQKAAQAIYAQEQAKVDAETAYIHAQGEARALQIRGDALRTSPEIVLLNIVEKWDGRAPSTLVLGGSGNLSSLLLNSSETNPTPPTPAGRRGGPPPQ